MRIWRAESRRGAATIVHRDDGRVEYVVSRQGQETNRETLVSGQGFDSETEAEIRVRKLLAGPRDPDGWRVLFQQLA